MIKDPLPQDSYNTKRNLKSVWDDKEVIVNLEELEKAPDTLKLLFIHNLITQYNEEFK